tara:strand:- start:205 stop:768 length:564 start_codon:yes stop_codon:yes gene_type:complete
MKHTESIAKLAAAMVAAQVEIKHAHNDSTNPHYKSTFASLPAVIDATIPLLNKYGLAVLQLPGLDDGCATVETILSHESGEWLSGVSKSPISKNDPQGVGSALTYLRRYSLAALCCIGQDDDDGNTASQKPPRAPNKETTLVAQELKKLLDTHKAIPADGRKAALAAYTALDLDRMKTAINYIKEKA